MLDTVPLQSRFLEHADHYARWSGLAVGIVAAQQLVTMESDDITMPLVFAITAFGLCAVGGVLLGDALTLRPQEAVRAASLAPRLVRAHVPPRMTPLLLLQAASLATLLVIGVVTASSDPGRIGGAGRVMTVTCEGIRTSLGPWPGLYYSGPMFAALAVGTPASVWALRRIAHGPGSDQQRRDRAWAITGAWGLLVSSQVLLVVLMIFVALTENACAGPLGAATIVVICPLGLLSMFTFGWSLITVVAPRAVDDEAAGNGTFDDE
ncbi:hypothetical protein [Streptomyces phaeochromogenes]|uniref:hypothetical protein n=1 Tax=Streptomyces phaeochromogenes TaxID=1923 RepID=UPI002DDAB8E1|nr:hypothetical protein [Streptomyces phaeochromogenes]WRZ35762.1 hypothetical protein OG931_52590 [Streptomyces phaeochromogenes]WSJ02304.1 hypothetical protein OG437_00865 [Streptomyces phaeochromogenes]